MELNKEKVMKIYIMKISKLQKLNDNLINNAQIKQEIRFQILFFLLVELLNLAVSSINLFSPRRREKMRQGSREKR